MYICVLCLFMCVIVIKIGLTAWGYRIRFDYILKTKQNYLFSNTQSFGTLSVVLLFYCPLCDDVFSKFIIILYKSTICDFIPFSFFTVLRFTTRNTLTYSTTHDAVCLYHTIIIIRSTCVRLIYSLSSLEMSVAQHDTIF